MRNKLLALAAALAVLGAGIYFINFDSTPGVVDERPWSFGAFEVVDRNQCSVSPCNAPACTQALNILADGGVTDATLKLIECPVRLGAKVRAQADDAGVSLPASRYAQMRLIAMRRPTDGGGFAVGIPVDDNGWPSFAVVSIPQPCAWKPDAGALCTKADGGDPGIENTLQPGDFVGVDCRLKSCVEVAGDTSAP